VTANRRATQSPESGQGARSSRASALLPVAALTLLAFVALRVASPAYAEPADPGRDGEREGRHEIRVEGELPPPIPEGQIEILAGSTRRRVPASISTEASDARLERGVLPIRGAEVGEHTQSFELRRTTVSGPMRARLERQLEALIQVYRDAFQLEIDAEFARDLMRLYPAETGPDSDRPLARSAYDHDLPPPDLRYRRATEAALMAQALHSTSHAILDRHWPDAPFWLDEGLAVVFEGIDTRGGGIQVELPELRLNQLRNQRYISPQDSAGTSPGIARPDPEALLALRADDWSALAPETARAVQAELGALALYFLEDPAFADAIAERFALPGMLDRIEVTPDEALQYAREWRRARDASTRLTLFDAQPDVPAPEPEPKRRRRRAFRCVPALVGIGGGATRAVLFCTRGNQLLDRRGDIPLD